MATSHTSVPFLSKFTFDLGVLRALSCTWFSDLGCGFKWRREIFYTEGLCGGKQKFRGKALTMDEAEAMVGMSDDENSSGKGEHTGDSASLITDNNEAGEGTMNGTGTGNDLINVALEDDVGDEDDEEDDDDDDETMNPVSAASALSDLVGSVGSVVTGLPSLNTNQNHHQSEDTTGQSAPTRYLQVEGYDGRKNDVVYCKPLRCSVKHAENSLEHTNNDQSSSATGSASEADAQTKSQKGESEEKPKLMLFFGGDIQVCNSYIHSLTSRNEFFFIMYQL